MPASPSEKSLENGDLNNDPSTASKQVEWDGYDDKENIRNASMPRKLMIATLLTLAGLEVTSTSSVWATSTQDIQKHFGSNHETTVAGISLYVWALAAGPLIGGPMSEAYGRRPVFISSLVGYVAFQFLTAFGKNIESLLIGRFLQGFFGSVFLSNAPAAVGDVCHPHQVAIFLNFNSLGVFMGPSLGPIIGSFSLIQGYRWPFYVFLMWAGFLAGLVVLLVPETYEPLLKARKAQRLRKELNDPEIYAEYERRDKNFLKSMPTYLKRPFQLFFLEPIMMLLCIYSGFLLSIVYLFFVAFPLVFGDVYNFKIQFVGLSYLGTSIGMAVAGCFIPLWENLRLKAVKKNDGVVEPEFRLMPMCIGSVVVPVGLFMFAWTIYPSVHWMVPIVASGIFGCGCFWTFNIILSYTVDAFKKYAASAVAANVFVRCMMAGVFPMIGDQLMHGMGRGYHWPLTFISFISVLLMPSSFLLYRYGRVLRSKSRFT